MGIAGVMNYRVMDNFKVKDGDSIIEISVGQIINLPELMAKLLLAKGKIKPSFPIKNSPGRKLIACDSCARRNRPKGDLACCFWWKRHYPGADSCSDYVGPLRECHYPLPWGNKYAPPLSKADPLREPNR